MCLTYGRIEELQEAIDSFLRQDYSGPKQLVVLNDLAEQNLVFDHPEVKIVNLQTRCPSIGEKRTLCAELSDHDILFVWDDDDIYLSHRLSHSVRQLTALGVPFYKPDQGYLFSEGRIKCLYKNLFHSQSCFTRELFASVGGYPPIGSGQDMDFEQKLTKLGVKTHFEEASENYFYLYRWSGVSTYHLSRFGRDQDHSRVTGQLKVGLAVRQGIKSGAIDTGTITLNPGWRRDYEKLVVDFLRREYEP
ncbi:MAG: glycosyltransferase family A protein [Pseudomonadota bacterium]